MPLPSAPRRSRSARGEVLREGERVALLGYGYGVPLALGAADGWPRTTASTPRSPTPASPSRSTTELIGSLAADHDVLVTVEENVLAGRLRLGGGGDAGRRRPAGRRRVLRFGLPDRYVTHGKPALLREEVGLTPEAVAERVAEAVLEPRGALA